MGFYAWICEYKVLMSIILAPLSFIGIIAIIILALIAVLLIMGGLDKVFSKFTFISRKAEERLYKVINVIPIIMAIGVLSLMVYVGCQELYNWWILKLCNFGG